jgi:hypothetical protein
MSETEPHRPRSGLGGSLRIAVAACSSPKSVAQPKRSLLAFPELRQVLHMRAKDEKCPDQKAMSAVTVVVRVIVVVATERLR